MSRGNTPPSSMELLLDAMCNVFGAVLFMAILIGGVSVSNQLAGNQEQVEADLIERQRERLKTLDSQLKVVDMELALQQNALPDDDNTGILQKNAQTLQNQFRQQVHSGNLLAEKIENLQNEYIRNQQKLEQLAPYTGDLQNNLQKIAAEKSMLRSALAGTAPTAYTPPSVGSESAFEPWRLLVTAGEIFVLGSNSDIRSGGLKKDSVSINYLHEAGTEYFAIRKKSGKGINLHNFSLRAMELPANDGKKYFVELLVEPDAVAASAKLIWELRQNNLAYNWRIISSDGTTLRSSTGRAYEVAR